MKDSKREVVEWDKKKIILFIAGVILLLAIIYVARNMMFAGTQSANPSLINTGVKGESIQSTQPLPDIKKSVQQQIDTLKNEAQNINVVDIATSSPQVQKVINDLKAIQDYPKSQLKATCEQICNGL
jgi:conjugal transfer/entry exclusion protein